jgi:hypothetical protein
VLAALLVYLCVASCFAVWVAGSDDLRRLTALYDDIGAPRWFTAVCAVAVVATWPFFIPATVSARVKMWRWHRAQRRAKEQIARLDALQADVASGKRSLGGTRYSDEERERRIRERGARR